MILSFSGFFYFLFIVNLGSPSVREAVSCLGRFGSILSVYLVLANY